MLDLLLHEYKLSAYKKGGVASLPSDRPWSSRYLAHAASITRNVRRDRPNSCRMKMLAARWRDMPRRPCYRWIREVLSRFPPPCSHCSSRCFVRRAGRWSKYGRESVRPRGRMSSLYANQADVAAPLRRRRSTCAPLPSFLKLAQTHASPFGVCAKGGLPPNQHASFKCHPPQLVHILVVLAATSSSLTLPQLLLTS